MRRTRPILFLSLLLLSLAGATALAHIPQLDWLMARMADKRAKLGFHRLKVELACGPGADALKPAVLYLKVPRQVRLERQDGSVLVCDQGRCQQQAPGQPPVAQPDWVFLQFFYFTEPHPTAERYARLLRALHVQTKVDTLTRAGSRVAVVLGAKEWERDRPQFWLDKDRYLPLRLMLLDQKALVDIQWLDWGSRTAGEWFPARLEVRRDGELIEQCQVEHVETNASMPDKLFQLDRSAPSANQ